MLIVDTWEDVVDSMLAALADPAKMDARQQATVRWYHQYMRGRAERVEQVLAEKVARNEKAFCHQYAQSHAGA